MGSTNQPQVTVGLCPRERFSKAPEVLARILSNTTVPYRLIVVDCNTPGSIWLEMERQLAGRDNVEVIRTPEHLLPAACKNLIIEQVDTEYLCLIENDVLVGSGWIERFLDSSRAHAAEVIIPLIYEVFDGHPEIPCRPHFDENLGKVVEHQTPEGQRHTIEPRTTSRFTDPGSLPRPQEFMEGHCLFFCKTLLDRMQRLDDTCSGSDEVDLSMAVRAAGGSAIFDPTCVVTFVQPPYPLDEVDRPYFLMRWEPRRVEDSHRRLVKRWKLTHSPQLLGFFHERYARGLGLLRTWRSDLDNLAEGRPIVLVDGEQFGSVLTEGLRKIPFTENHGTYWGDPANDAAAIREIEKDCGVGAGLIVFTWNTFWYFTIYHGFSEYLQQTYRRVLDDARMVVFDLDKARN